MSRPLFSDEPRRPCPGHPGWEQDECVFCRPWLRSPRSRPLPDVLSKREERELSTKIGKRVQTRSEAKAAIAKKGLREAEKGEVGYERFDALREHAESGGKLDEKHTLAGMDLYGDYARMKPFDAEARYEYHRKRLGLA